MVNIGSPGLVNKGSQMHWFNVGSSLIIIKLRISRLGFLMNYIHYTTAGFKLESLHLVYTIHMEKDIIYSSFKYKENYTSNAKF